MPRLIVQNLFDTAVEITSDTASVLYHLQTQGLDWMHACGGKGRCTTCKMIVITGLEQLSEATPAELRYHSEGRLGDNERLTCQCRLLTGNVIVRVPLLYQLPHVRYSE